MRLNLLGTALLLLCCNITSFATGNAIDGQTKSKICAVCHGDTGISVNALWPKLAQQHQGYLAKQLQEMRLGDKGPRYAPTMYGMIANLTDQDIEDLAAFYSSQKSEPGMVKAAYLETGKKLYFGGNIKKSLPACSGCHGSKGQGNKAAKFPSLAGQNSEYIADQLQKFAKEERANDPNGIMRDIAKRMTDEEIKAVSSYVAGMF